MEIFTKMPFFSSTFGSCLRLYIIKVVMYVDVSPDKNREPWTTQ